MPSQQDKDNHQRHMKELEKQGEAFSKDIHEFLAQMDEKYHGLTSNMLFRFQMELIIVYSTLFQSMENDMVRLLEQMGPDTDLHPTQVSSRISLR